MEGLGHQRPELRLQSHAQAGADTGQTLTRNSSGPLPTSQWLEDDKHAVTVTAVFPKVARDPAKATALFSLFDSASSRVITLPPSKRTHDEFGEIGEVEVIR
jgi:hypothetical protein